MKLGVLATVMTMTSFAFAGGRPYVTIQDDGTVQAALDAIPQNGTLDPTIPLLKLYAATGFPIPQILSVWTTFPQDGETVATYFLPQSNNVKGIGLTGLPPTSKNPPLEDALFHNDVLSIATRAALAGAPADGYGEYLFLLELSHKWCSSAVLPVSDAGTQQDLIGFPFHWSFWMDATGSPGGGNRWIDHGNGSYSIVAATPSGVAFSMLDLYLMGLAGANEVPAFGVLEQPVPPSGVTDGLWGGAYAAHSFPWFGSTTFTAQAAARRSVTVDDVIAANGTRQPAFGAAPTSWTLGIVLLAAQTDTATRIASAQAALDPIATNLAPRFSTATQGRGTLVVVTAAADDAGTSAAEAGADAGSVGDNEPVSTSSGGCGVASGGVTSPWLLAAGLAFWMRRRRR